MDDPNTITTPKKGRRVPATWQERFLASLRKYGNVSAAAKAARVGRHYVYDQRTADATFAAAWDDALIEAVEGLEGEAWRRAATGVVEPVYHLDKKLGTVRKYSDTLLIFLLKAHAPAKYRETTRHELTGADGQPVQVEVSDLRERIARRLAAVTAGSAAPELPGESAG
jgi:hypothetical protein